jgi:hypothetical protein
MQELRRGIEDVLETLRRANLRGEKATLLVGAGCSVSAGIPLAEEMMRSIEEEFPRAAQRASGRSYAAYLKELSPGEQQALINRCVHHSQVNPTYLAIAHLIKGGFVDRVLTTNFDPLLVRACALAGEFPAVFNVPQLSPDQLLKLPDTALFYLQGQGTGNTHIPPRYLKAVLEESTQNRPLIIVGYSGTDSTVFPRLALQKHYSNRLYWVSHDDEAPAECVQSRLLKPGKEAYWLSGYSSDRFFVQLVHQLGVFSSDFADRLLEHPQAIMETLCPASQPDVILERLQEQVQAPRPKDVHPSFVASQLREADELVLRAQFKANREADVLFEAAYARYAGALVLQPDTAEVLVQWAMALSEQAKLKSGAEAERLLGTACEKYMQATVLQSQDSNIEYLWGMALSRRAQLTRGEASQALVCEAQEHLSKAEALNPGSAAYFLACLTGSRGDVEGTRRWLTRCQEQGVLPLRGMLESNPVFRNFVSQPWFAALYQHETP